MPHSKGDYLPVQKKFDHPYDRLAAPAKIPGAALEFTGIPGSVDSVRLYLANALCQVRWNNGIQLQTFVHANEPLGWFEFRNIPDSIVPAIIAPRYSGRATLPLPTALSPTISPDTTVSPTMWP